MLFDKDAGHKDFLEEVYELQTRLPGGNWGLASVPWTDVVRAAGGNRPSIFFLQRNLFIK